MLGGANEVQIYLDSQWIGACEAVWHFMEYELHVHKPNIVCLPVHEEGMHHMVFNEEDDVEDILRRNQQTKLTAYFEVSHFYTHSTVQFSYTFPLEG